MSIPDVPGIRRDPRSILGQVEAAKWLPALAVLLLILILIASTGRRSIGATLALAVLTVVQGILGGTGDSAQVAGAFHAINAFLILGLSLFLTWRAWRGQLLIPPPIVREEVHA